MPATSEKPAHNVARVKGARQVPEARVSGSRARAQPRVHYCLRAVQDVSECVKRLLILGLVLAGPAAGIQKRLLLPKAVASQ